MKTTITRILWFALLGATGFGLGYWIRIEPILEGYKYLGYFGALLPGAISFTIGFYLTYIIHTSFFIVREQGVCIQINIP